MTEAARPQAILFIILFIPTSHLSLIPPAKRPTRAFRSFHLPAMNERREVGMKRMRMARCGPHSLFRYAPFGRRFARFRDPSCSRRSMSFWNTTASPSATAFHASEARVH